MRLQTRTGAIIPLWFSDLLDYQSIATTMIDPVATYQASAKTTADEAAMNKYIYNGFGVKNATENAGYIYAVTWEQFDAYKRAHKQLTPAQWSTGSITPRRLYVLGGEWVLTPVIKVFADNSGGTPSTVTTVQVGLIL